MNSIQVSRRRLLSGVGAVMAALTANSVIGALISPERTLYVKAGEVIRHREFVGYWRFICEPGATFTECTFRALQGEGKAAFVFDNAWPPTVADRPTSITHCRFFTL